LADSFDPDADDVVLAIALQTDGKILAGGGFTSIGGQARNFIARLEGTKGLADSFNPNASDVVLSIAQQADGKILAGGQFFGASAERRVITSRGSMPPPDWLIRSTRAPMVPSFPSRSRRTGKF